MNLPVPDQRSLLHSKQLTDHIKYLIESQGGSIGFDEFMSTVLYEPGLGYYSAGSYKLGLDGDFITAPEISPLFSFCLARQCLEVIAELQQPIILELGAGTGVMARDIMLELERLGCLPDQYWILEISADLKQRQQVLLKKSLPPLLYERFVWLNKLPKHAFSGIVLANEVLDALPVKRFKKVFGTFREMKVGLRNDQFCWMEDEFDIDLLKLLYELENGLPEKLPEQYVSEFNFNLSSWLHAVASRFDQGLMLFIDYGYDRKAFYHSEKNNGTLLCHYRHRVHQDPFLYPGLQDISASVDFTALAAAAYVVGLTIGGYTTQAYFLVGCDLNQFTSSIMSMNMKDQVKLMQQIRMLTLPDHMGERFKVMALIKRFNKSLKGFSIMDQRFRL